MFLDIYLDINFYGQFESILTKCSLIRKAEQKIQLN